MEEQQAAELARQQAVQQAQQAQERQRGEKRDGDGNNLPTYDDEGAKVGDVRQRADIDSSEAPTRQ